MRTGENLRALQPTLVERQPISKISGRPASLPTVSAVIPCYNGAASVDVAIASALAQTHHLLEIIVVDDGSRDDSAAIASRYPVKVLRVPNRGPGAARNIGVRQSSGQWIAFLDHDDRWVPDKVSLQFQYAAENTGLICCPALGLHDYQACPAKPPRPGEAITFEQLWLYNVVGCPSGVMMRRQAFDEVGGFDEHPDLVGAEDYNLWQRVALAGWKVQAGPLGVFNYTPAHGSISSQSYRMLKGALLDIEIVGQLAGMTPQQMERKRRFARMECAHSLLWSGDQAAARRLLLQEPFGRDLLRLWAAALLPEWLLRPFRSRPRK